VASLHRGLRSKLGNREVVPCDFVCEGVIRFSGFSGDMEIDITTFIFLNIILNPLQGSGTM
jgi:hypothetical protein